MCVKVLELIICLSVTFIHNIQCQFSTDMVEDGKQQYQLLLERGNLPKYGSCWKSAILYIEQTCNNLSEDTQSDMALHFTNCFLEMSGHETYNCEGDKKENLRRICISSMSDRAFNVYTEFYTHTQNICWFLRGQVWQETIAENTVHVAKQLHNSAIKQADILKAQYESLSLQEKILLQGQDLEKIMHDFSEISTSLNSLKLWLLGEMSSFNMIVFYSISVIFTMLITASPRTFSARLPILLLLVGNLLFERCIYSLVVSVTIETDVHLIHAYALQYVWFFRNAFIVLAVLILVYKMIVYKDINVENNSLLNVIHKQTTTISQIVSAFQNKGNSEIRSIKNDISVIDERGASPKLRADWFNNNSTSEKMENSRESSVSTVMTGITFSSKGTRKCRRKADLVPDTHDYETDNSMNNVNKTPILDLTPQKRSHYSLRSKLVV